MASVTVLPTQASLVVVDGALRGPTGATGPAGAAGVTNITGLISAGANVTFTGSGTSASPFVVSASAPGNTYTAGAGLTLSGTQFSLTSPVAISNGGTGSVTQNFVDLTTTQTVAGAKSFSSAMTANGITNLGNTSTSASTEYVLSRTVPTVLNDEVDIGTLTTSVGGTTLDVSIAVNNSSFSVAKRYHVAINYIVASVGWQVVSPLSDSGPYSGNDFSFEINVLQNTIQMRLRRSGGSVTAGTANIILRAAGSLTNSLVGSTATSSVSAPTLSYPSSNVTQVSNFVAIGANLVTPTHTLTLGSDSTGIAQYNTSTQTTNYERFKTYWASNTFNMNTEAAGTGTARNLSIGTSSRRLVINETPTSAGIYRFDASTSALSSTGVNISGTPTQSSGTFGVLAITPTITQTATGGYTAILANVTEATVGSGPKLLVDLQVGGVSLTSIDNTGTINLTGTASQISNYNLGSPTATNYERVREYWSGNVYNIAVENGGTGSIRTISIGGSGKSFIFATSSTGLGMFQFAGSTAGIGSIVSVNGSYNAAAGQLAFMRIAPTITMTGTGSYTGLLVNPTETSVGSGPNLLADFQTGSTSKMSIANDGTVTNVTLAGTGVRMVTASATGVLATQAIPTGGGGNTTNITTNTIKYDQTPASGTYGTLAGLVNGSNKVYTVSNGSYQTGTLNVVLNGQDLTQTTDWSETAPGSGTFTFVTAPPTGSIVLVNYTIPSSTSGNFSQPYSLKTAAYTATATDKFLDGDATTAAFAFTLPAASSVTGYEYVFDKLDSSANAITVTRAGTDLINGSTTYVLSTQYKYVRLISTGSGWRVVGNN